MKNIKNAEYFMKFRPFETWIYFIEKYNNQGYIGIELWKKISESVMITNILYSNYLGIE